MHQGLCPNCTAYTYNIPQSVYDRSIKLLRSLGCDNALPGSEDGRNAASKGFDCVSEVSAKLGLAIARGVTT